MKEKITAFICNRFLHGETDLDVNESLFASGIIDSLRLFELIAFIEKTFAVSVNMSEVTIENFDSVNSIAKLVEKKLRKKTA
jgi:acyl carrier protein/D-alanine--poly(phosphoribitol) ligase subunit 2